MKNLYKAINIQNLFKYCNRSTTSACLTCIDLTPCSIATKFSVFICVFLEDDAVVFVEVLLLLLLLEEEEEDITPPPPLLTTLSISSLL
jgi:hypothetical protein